jgi:hypothetical protein
MADKDPGRVGERFDRTLEIEADLPQGIPDDVQRAITENARTLGFTASEFEET